MLDGIEMWHDFIRPKFIGSARDSEMLGAEIFRREDAGGVALFDEERTALYCRHSNIPAAPCPPPTHMVTNP